MDPDARRSVAAQIIDYTQELALVEFAKWMLHNAEENGLKILWGDGGPLLK